MKITDKERSDFLRGLRSSLRLLKAFIKVEELPFLMNLKVETLSTKSIDDVIELVTAIEGDLPPAELEELRKKLGRL